ncbi:hypothetical protein HD806DRAFT_505022 [Xylariaceae sp. AK1471]|nr:hypothetical protein HD806DRAFT_505022 [Xylariaceae sp. AK1471]
MRRTISRLASLGSPNAYVQSRLPPISVSKLINPASEYLHDPVTEIEPGQHVISICKRHNIGFPNQLWALKGIKLEKNPYKLNVSISQRHCFEQKSMRYFDTFEHPFAKSMLDIYIEKTKEPLWISCHAYGASPFPNKKASKKVSHALRDALAAAGYDRLGQRVLVDGESSAIADLYGTLRVIVGDPQAVCNAKFVDLLKNAKSIISGAEIQLRRDNNGQHLGKQQHRPPTRKGSRSRH